MQIAGVHSTRVSFGENFVPIMPICTSKCLQSFE